MFRKTKTVETITSSLSTIVDDLHSHAADQDNQAAGKAATITVLGEQIAVHRDQAGRARTIAGKIGDLIG